MRAPLTIAPRLLQAMSRRSITDMQSRSTIARAPGSQEGYRSRLADGYSCSNSLILNNDLTVMYFALASAALDWLSSLLTTPMDCATPHSISAGIVKTISIPIYVVLIAHSE